VARPPVDDQGKAGERGSLRQKKRKNGLQLLILRAFFSPPWASQGVKTQMHPIRYGRDTRPYGHCHKQQKISRKEPHHAARPN